LKTMLINDDDDDCNLLPSQQRTAQTQSPKPTRILKLNRIQNNRKWSLRSGKNN
jgi:hypothetical protein